MELTNFYTEVLRELKVVPPNGDALAEDLTIVQNKYPSVHAMLLSEGLVEWSVTEPMPDKFVVPMAAIVAYACKNDFSVPDQDEEDLKMRGQLFGIQPSEGERQLRKLLEAEYVQAPVTSEYF